MNHFQKMAFPCEQVSLKLITSGILMAIAFQYVATFEHREAKQRYLVPDRVVKTNRPIIGQYRVVTYRTLTRIDRFVFYHGLSLNFKNDVIALKNVLSLKSS